MKKNCFYRTLSIIMLLSCFMPVMSQKIGKTSYRRVFGGGGGLEKICYKKDGSFYAGDIMTKFPDGTIVEAKHIGRGYYTTKYYDYPEEGILYGTENVKPEDADPKKAIGQWFEGEIYATEYPSLGDKPIYRYHVNITANPNPTEETGDAIVNITTFTSPDTPNEKEYQSIYYGKFLPYCISISTAQIDGKMTPIKEIRIYTESIYGKVAAVYLNGMRYNKVNF